MLLDELWVARVQHVAWRDGDVVEREGARVVAVEQVDLAVHARCMPLVDGFLLRAIKLVAHLLAVRNSHAHGSLERPVFSCVVKAEAVVAMLQA